MSEKTLREQITQLSKSLFDRGYTVGTSGNISVALPEGGFLMTPTNSSMGFLDPEQISKLDRDGNHVSGDKPTKELAIHLAMYETRPNSGAVVHLHSTWSTALSCLKDTDPNDCIPPLTPYVVMRVGKVKMLPYVRPGDPKAGDMIRQLRGECAGILLANHGPVLSGRDLISTVSATEELEETAKLLVALRGLSRPYADGRKCSRN